MVKEERERKRQLREQDGFKSEQESKKKKLHAYNDFIQFLREKSLRETSIILFNSRFNLFNGRQLGEIIEREYNQICNILADHYTPVDKSETDEAKKRISLVSFLLKDQIVVKVEENPQKSKLKTTQDKFIASKEQKVVADSDIVNGFFVFNPHIRVQSKRNYVYMTLILLGIALIILFPVWPLSLKKLIFYISVVLLFVLVGLIVVRTFFYFLVRIFGFDFYIFPNLFADVGFFESFKPIIQMDKCDDSKLELLCRFVGFFVMGYVIYLLSIERHAVKQFGATTFDEIVDWGYQKLEFVPTTAPHNSILHEIEKEEHEENLKQNAEGHYDNLHQEQEQQQGTQFHEEDDDNDEPFY